MGVIINLLIEIDFRAWPASSRQRRHDVSVLTSPYRCLPSGMRHDEITLEVQCHHANGRDSVLRDIGILCVI